MSAKTPQRTEAQSPGLVTTVIEAVLIAVFIRTLLFQPFNIPSGSMEPTLLIGDYLFVSKYSYGYSRYSIPFAPPVISGRIFYRPPDRGDIVVFRHGPDDFIKRVIGLPGDRIQLTDGVVSINGTPVKRQRVADFVGQDPCGTSFGRASIAQWREELPNGVAYNTLQCGSYSGFPDTTDVYSVPADHFFMMGDNRENSEDSRFADVGYVPAENLLGKAQVIFFSIGGGYSAWELWRWNYVRWNRLFHLVR